jgi:predicted RNase H-like HicB family nuclease
MMMGGIKKDLPRRGPRGEKPYAECATSSLVKPVSLMKRRFTVSLQREGEWFVSQCLEVDFASQGRTGAEAPANLREALMLHFKAPGSTATPDIRRLEIEVGGA